MATSGDLITAAFLKVGIDVPTTAQTASALISLNNMISFWGVELLQPSLTRENFTLTSGTAEYTWGSGGSITTTRPIRIANAYLRDSSSYDTPLDVMSGKDYGDITDKTASGRPGKLYFTPEETLAKIIFECKPDAAYVLYLESWKPLTEFAATSTSVTLPNEYKEAIVYNLAVSLAEDWDRVVSNTVQRKAMETKEALGAANAATRPVPMAKFDFLDELPFNITTG